MIEQKREKERDREAERQNEGEGCIVSQHRGRYQRITLESWFSLPLLLVSQGLNSGLCGKHLYLLTYITGPAVNSFQEMAHQ